MANSKSGMATPARLDRLESALVHLTDVIVLQGERMDFGFTTLREEMRSMREEMRTVRDEMRALSEESRMRFETLTYRFDRFVGMTTKERTSSVERFALIEERLTRLEERDGNPR